MTKSPVGVNTRRLTSSSSWSWTPAEGLSCDDCERPWAGPYRSGQYRLVVTDLSGCTAQASVNIQVDRRRDVYAPNVFSPNGDGLNDRFTIYGRGITEIKLLQVFDRWGNQLFLGERLTLMVMPDHSGVLRKKLLGARAVTSIERAGHRLKVWHAQSGVHALVGELPSERLDRVASSLTP